MATYVIGPKQKVAFEGGAAIGSAKTAYGAGTTNSGMIDITDQLTSISFDETRDILDTTVLSKEAREYLPGLRSGTGTLEFLVDYATGKNNDVVRRALRDNDDPRKLRVALNDGTAIASPTNPYDQMQIWITGATRGGSVGEVATMSVPFTIEGDPSQRAPSSNGGDFTAN